MQPFSGKERGCRKLVSWQPDFVTSAARGALIISLGVCGNVNLHKASPRQQLDTSPALENLHTPEGHVWWLQQLKSLANLGVMQVAGFFPAQLAAV